MKRYIEYILPGVCLLLTAAALISAFSGKAIWAAVLCAYAAAAVIALLLRKKYAQSEKRLSARLEQAESELKDARYNLRERYMKGLVQGEIPPADRLNPFLERYEISFPTEDFAAASIVITDESGFYSDDSACEHPSIDAMLRLREALIKVFTEELSPLAEFNLINVDGSLAAILALKEEIPSEGEAYVDAVRATTVRLESMLEACVRRMEAEHHVLLLVAVSTPFHSIYALSKAYVEAMELAEYGFGSRKVLSPCSVNMEEAIGRADSIRRIDCERQFYNFIVSQEFEKAGAVLLERLRDDREQQPVPFLRMKNDLLRRVDFMISAAGMSWHTLLPEGGEIIRTYLDMRESTDAEELERRTEQFCREFQIYWENYTRNSTGRAGQIMEYIHQSYANPNLNSTMICESFGISQAYLSRMFKQSTGVGVLEYIHRTRIDEAKKLLVTDITINEIADRVGYYSRRTLTQAFKRCEGVTPDTWRKNIAADFG